MPFHPLIIMRSSAAWTPASLGSALRGWYLGSAIGTDTSGIGNTLTVTGTTGGAGLNGHSTTLFNGTSDIAARNSSFNFSMGGTTGFTIALVLKEVTSTSVGEFCGTTTDNIHFHQLIENIGGADNIRYDNTTGTGGTLVGAGFKRLLLTDDGTNSNFYVSGTATGAAAASTGFMASAVSFAIGARADGAASFANIDVAEVIVVLGVVSSTDRTNIDTYLTNKYGV